MALRLMHRNEPTLECSALSLSREVQDWLNEEQIDLTLYNLDEGIWNTAVSTLPG